MILGPDRRLFHLQNTPHRIPHRPRRNYDSALPRGTPRRQSRAHGQGRRRRQRQRLHPALPRGARLPPGRGVLVRRVLPERYQEGVQGAGGGTEETAGGAGRGRGGHRGVVGGGGGVRRAGQSAGRFAEVVAGAGDVQRFQGEFYREDFD